MGPVQLLALLVLHLALTGTGLLSNGWLLTCRWTLPVLCLSLLDRPVGPVFEIAVLITLVDITIPVCEHVIRLVRRPGPVVNIV
jgi:hypothetical protein